MISAQSQPGNSLISRRFDLSVYPIICIYQAYKNKECVNLGCADQRCEDQECVNLGCENQESVKITDVSIRNMKIRKVWRSGKCEDQESV